MIAENQLLPGFYFEVGQWNVMKCRYEVGRVHGRLYLTAKPEPKLQSWLAR
jgi:hypothetical protein